MTILIGLTLVCVLTDFSRPTFPESEAVRSDEQSIIEIEVTGEEFFWTFRYAGEDGALRTNDDIILPRELIVPLNRQVRLQLKSLDYVYVFEISPLAVREIAVPDLMYSVEFFARKSMTSSLPMDPLCAFGLFQNDSMGTIRADDVAWRELVARR
jgi:heme/copper-type cytochrome/quinol oxidase subunit 2